jgi:hypothetical protein
VSVLLIDRQTYLVFVPGQLRVCKEIGSAEAAYDTVGMVVVKRRSVLFRHWLLGFGAGDLLVKPADANALPFEMQNVLFVKNKLQLIQEMLQTREVVGSA